MTARPRLARPSGLGRRVCRGFPRCPMSGVGFKTFRGEKNVGAKSNPGHPGHLGQSMAYYTLTSDIYK